jgi:hypothetical protein
MTDRREEKASGSCGSWVDLEWKLGSAECRLRIDEAEDEWKVSWATAEDDAEAHDVEAEAEMHMSLG